MGSLFRSPGDISSSDPESSSSSEGDVRQSPGAGETDTEADTKEETSSVVETHQDDGEADAAGTLNKELDYGGIPDVDAEGHAAVMTSALLEYYCTNRAAEILNSQPGSQGRYTRDSPEAKFLGRRLYAYKSRFLSSHGVLTDGIEGEDWETSRQYYRDSLDVLGTAALEGLDLNTKLPAVSRGAIEDAPPAEGALGFWTPKKQDRKVGPSRPVLGLQRRITDHAGASNAAAAAPVNDENVPPGFMGLAQRPQPTSPQKSSFASLTPNAYAQQLGMSRYAAEFEEEGVIGKGAYGAVYKVKHHVDGQVYAVKKIPLSANRLKQLQDGGLRELDNILKEIRTLARLEHQNVVRYFGAWAEYAASPKAQVSTDIPTAVTKMGGRQPQGLLSHPSANEEDLSFSVVFEGSGHGAVIEESDHGAVIEESDHGIVFEESSKSKENTRGSHSKEDSKPESGDPEISRAGDDDENENDDDDEDVESITRRFSLPFHVPSSSGPDEDIFTDGNGGSKGNNQLGRPLTASGQVPAITLHIQMSLHPLNLAQYLSAQVHADESNPQRHCFHLLPSLKILLGVVSGVEYLHAQGIIHRDLKPANIFLAPSTGEDGADCPACDETGFDGVCYTVPRIGDFGLVAHTTPEEGKDADPVSARPVGTEFYRPPMATAAAQDASEKENDGEQQSEAEGEPDVDVDTGLRLDESLDIFALGVILFELLYKLDTRMERQMVLSALTCPQNKSKRPKLPADFAAMVDKHHATTLEGGAEKAWTIAERIGQCILGMVEPDWRMRWKCKDVRRCLETVYSLVNKDAGIAHG